MEFRRGAEAISAAAERKGGSFRPFVPSIYWKDGADKDGNDLRSRYLLILNSVDQIPSVNTIGFISQPDSAVGEMVIARTDPAIGERVDPLERDWNYAVQESNIMVAVELEPLIENVNGRDRPRGFEVKTKDFVRRVRDDKGELTEETEEVVAPAVGVIVQRPTNFGNIIVSFNEQENDIERTPVKITRQPTSPLTFQIQGYPDMNIDLTNLVEYVDGITYLNDEMDELVETISDMDPYDAANVIGEVGS